MGQRSRGSSQREHRRSSADRVLYYGAAQLALDALPGMPPKNHVQRDEPQKRSEKAPQ